MMIRLAAHTALVVIGIGVTEPAVAQESKPKLPFELQVIKAEYNKKRAEGLTRLYRQTIESLRETQAPFLRDGKLKESAAIENKINELEKKIAALAAGKIDPVSNEPTQPEGLVGTKWTGDHPTRSGTIVFEFLDAKTVRFSHGAYKLDWQWEETEKGVVVELWNRFSAKGRGWQMTINEAGTDAEILVRSENGKGTLKKSP